MIVTKAERCINAAHAQLRAAGDWLSVVLNSEPALSKLPSCVADTLLATHELLANQIDHACAGRGGLIWIIVEVDLTHREIRIDTRDSGTVLATATLANTEWRQLAGGARELMTVREPAWDQPRGRGLYLIRALTDHTRYMRENDCNHWTLIKTWN